MDAAAAQYLFNMQIDSARHPRIASLVRDLKNNSGNDVNAFKDALLGLEGAHATVEDGVLLLTHQLIGQKKTTRARFAFQTSLPTLTQPSRTLRPTAETSRCRRVTVCIPM